MAASSSAPPRPPGRLLCEDTWNTDLAIAGGGALIDNGVHLFDLARWFLDDEFVDAQGWVTQEPRRVRARAGRHPRRQGPSECEDNGFGLFRTADGRVASIHASWLQWQGYLYVEIFGTHGSIVIDNDQIQGTRVVPRLRPARRPHRHHQGVAGPAEARSVVAAPARGAGRRYRGGSRAEPQWLRRPPGGAHGGGHLSSRRRGGDAHRRPRPGRCSTA